MQSHYNEFQSVEDTSPLLYIEPNVPEADDAAKDTPTTNHTTRFHSHYVGCMEMYADTQTVAEYLNSHQGWFVNCAQPMQVEPIGNNGYALVIGRFGAFGYEVEPKIGLELLVPEQSVYRIRTMPVPDYTAPGYEVDYQSSMKLVEHAIANSIKAEDNSTEKLTRVEWELDLAVDVHFPKFIQRLPKAVIQTTGDRLLNQIVRQVSRRLTYKVQEDFHKSLGLPFPIKSRKKGGEGVRG